MDSQYGITNGWKTVRLYMIGWFPAYPILMPISKVSEVLCLLSQVSGYRSLGRQGMKVPLQNFSRVHYIEVQIDSVVKH